MARSLPSDSVTLPRGTPGTVPRPAKPPTPVSRSRCPQAGLDVSKHGGSAYNYDMGFAANGSVPERSENDVKVQV